MTPLIPFAIGLLGAVLSELRGQPAPPGEFGATAAVKTLTPTAASPTLTTVTGRVVAPTRFTKGTALASVAAAKKHKFVVGEAAPEEAEQEGELEEDDLEEEEEEIDPEEVVRHQIEQELMYDSIAQEVIEDMEIGEWDEGLEESVPDNDRYGFKAPSAQPIFDTMSGWGITRRRT